MRWGDDRGLCGAYAGEHASYEDNCRKLLQELRGIPPTKRRARFVTVAAIAFPAGETASVRRCLGRIDCRRGQAGSHGFGYDPIFIVPEYQQTLAQLSPDGKNRISHRARAFSEAKRLSAQMMAERNPVGA